MNRQQITGLILSRNNVGLSVLCRIILCYHTLMFILLFYAFFRFLNKDYRVCLNGKGSEFFRSLQISCFVGRG